MSTGAYISLRCVLIFRDIGLFYDLNRNWRFMIFYIHSHRLFSSTLSTSCHNLIYIH